MEQSVQVQVLSTALQIPVSTAGHQTKCKRAVIEITALFALTAIQVPETASGAQGTGSELQRTAE